MCTIDRLRRPLSLFQQCKWQTARRSIFMITKEDMNEEIKFVPIPRDNKLPMLERHPRVYKKPEASRKRTIDYRGPEMTVNYLLFKKCGIQATSGGKLTFEQTEDIRKRFNNMMDPKRMYAIWRIDSPWKGISRKPLNSRMGGGKPEIKFFVTPIRQDRIICELNGNFDYKEVEFWLKEVCQGLPLEARPVSQEMMIREKEEANYVEKNNLNPFNLDDCIRNNNRNCQKWFSVYNQVWGGRYR
ncbi:MAG: mitochondrial ribosomal large subunit component [Marteilia pararefringens]